MRRATSYLAMLVGATAAGVFVAGIAMGLVAMMLGGLAVAVGTILVLDMLDRRQPRLPRNPLPAAELGQRRASVETAARRGE